MKILSYVLALLATIAMSTATLSHNGATGPTLVRMNAMTDMQKSIKSIATSIKSGNQEPDELSSAIDTLIAIGENLPALFSENHLSATSQASPKIWSDPAGFQLEIDLFNQNLFAAKAEFEASSYATGMKALAASCKSCHTAFRITKQ